MPAAARREQWRSMRTRERGLGDGRGEPCRDLTGGGAAVRDAIGNADPTEAAAGDEKAGMRRELTLDGGESIEVSDLVLRVGVLPAVNAREERIAGDPDQRTHGPQRRGDH